MRKTIFFNGRFLAQPPSGMQRYACEMLTALDRQVADEPHWRDVELVALAPAGPLHAPAWRTIRVRQAGRLKGHAWEQVELAWLARGGPLVSLAGSGPYLHRRHILALHDANVFAHPEFFSPAYARWQRAIRPRLARAAASLVTVSEFSRRELARHCGVDAGKFAVLPNSAEHILGVRPDPTVLAQWGLRPGGYALTVGNQSPNKNIALAVQAFLQAQVPGAALVVAGDGAARVFAPATLTTHPSVKVIGRVSDAQLRALYEHAAVLLFPSIYEGFGIPPLEALLLGCPVIASPNAAVPEVLGDAAEYFSGLDDFAAKIARALAAGPARAQAEGARRVAAKYSWRRSAAGLAQLLHPAT